MKSWISSFMAPDLLSKSTNSISTRVKVFTFLHHFFKNLWVAEIKTFHFFTHKFISNTLEIPTIQMIGFDIFFSKTSTI